MTNTELGFPVEQKHPIQAIDTSFPVHVVLPGHGMTNGQFVRATNFFVSPPNSITGMYQLNNNLYMIKNVTTDTFDLFNQDGDAIDGTNYTPFIVNELSQFTLTGPNLMMENLNTQEGIV